MLEQSVDPARVHAGGAPKEVMWDILLLWRGRSYGFKLGKKTAQSLAISSLFLLSFAVFNLTRVVHMYKEHAAAEALRQENGKLQHALSRLEHTEQSRRRYSDDAEFLVRHVLSTSGIAPVKKPIAIGPLRSGSTPIQKRSFRPVDAPPTMQTLWAMSDRVAEKKAIRRRTPSVSPSQHSVLTSGFGYRHHPLHHVYRMHSGIDLAGQYGSPVIAAADGQVVFAAHRSGYGSTVIIDHGRGYQTHYAHLSAIDVQPGDKITRAQRIGAIGTTGAATGPHVHYEVRLYGKPVNPSAFLLDRH